jgi:ABC-2 type transport system permease protein
VLLGSKVLALLQVQVLLLFVMMLCGIGLQLYNGYYHFEIGLYLFHLFVITFPTLLIWAALSVCIHTMVPNVYMGIFLLLLIWIGKDQLPQVGIETYLVRFNSPPQLVYSDLNGFGHQLVANFMINAYWLTFSIVMILVSYLFWERGYSYSLIERLKKSAQQLNGIVSFFLITSIALFSLLGLTIYKEENSSSRSVGNSEILLADFRTNFEKFKSAFQPKIASVKLNMEIFPESNSFKVRGQYLLINKTSQRIDTLLIRTGYDEITTYSLGEPTNVVQKDEAMQFAVHILEDPMEPGDSIRMQFEIRNKPNTLFDQNSGVLQNGTFLRTDILPRLGYFFDEEYKEPNDSLAKYSNFYSPDADLVDIETVISTNHVQIAIAPGTLQKQWTENGRNYFHYKTDDNIKFAFAFNSGDYSVSKSNHNEVNVEIYHHGNHIFNLKDMTDGLKASLDYNTRFFGPYQHAEIRTIEFPHTEGSYATVMSNAIPTSEARFILRNGVENNEINLSFYVQAHELTHQWWGNQVVPADALGAKMLTESITEYISLRIYERFFGPEKALHFLGLQRKRYLEGRTQESGKESPLYLVRPDQEYIAYGKGALAFNALYYFVGEEKLNRILNEFLDNYKLRTDLYPTSVDLVAHLKHSIPPEYQYIITDMMESITFYDNKIIDVKELPNDQLEIQFSIKKLDNNMQDVSIANRIFMLIGQYDDDGNLLHTDISKVNSGVQSIRISRAPGLSRIVLDPLLHFIELDIENNTYELK